MGVIITTDSCSDMLPVCSTIYTLHYSFPCVCLFKNRSLRGLPDALQVAENQSKYVS